jgi:5-methylcytosine-specific restriction endonuclease McrA
MRLSKAKREALRKLPYPKYLKTDFWQAVRKIAIERAGNACQLCNAKGRLQVHHRTYKNKGYEDQNMQDLVALCGACHWKFHAVKIAKPTKIKK